MQWQRELLLISNLIEYLNYGKGKKRTFNSMRVIDIKTFQITGKFGIWHLTEFQLIFEYFND